MNLEKVFNIMGKPKDIREVPLHSDEFCLVYDSPAGFSDDFEIFISKKDSSVLSIYKGD